MDAFVRSQHDPDQIPAGGYAEIAQRLNRTAKQCRERWHNYLRGGIQKGKWQPEEEDIIRDLYQTFGSRYVRSNIMMMVADGNFFESQLDGHGQSPPASFGQ